MDWIIAHHRDVGSKLLWDLLAEQRSLTSVEDAREGQDGRDLDSNEDIWLAISPNSDVAYGYAHVHRFRDITGRSIAFFLRDVFVSSRADKIDLQRALFLVVEAQLLAYKATSLIVSSALEKSMTWRLAKSAKAEPIGRFLEYGVFLVADESARLCQ